MPDETANTDDTGPDCRDDQPGPWDWRQTMKLLPRDNKIEKMDNLGWPETSEDVKLKVERGEITPEEAEQKAKESGWPPFARKPKFFEPSAPGIVLWTPEMLLGWIGNRTLKAVYRHYKPFYQNIFVWVQNQYIYLLEEKKTIVWFHPKKAAGNHRDGHDLIELVATSYPDGFLDFDGRPGEFVDLEKEMPLLKSHLSGGLISALGHPSLLYSANLRITPEQWMMGEFRIDPVLGGVLKGPGYEFTNVQFFPSGVLAAYKPDRSQDPGRLEYRETDAWMSSMPKQTEYKAVIVQCLRNAFPEGMPRIYPVKERLKIIKTILGEANTHRWFKNMDENDADSVETKYQSFGRAIDRILKDNLISYPGSKPKKLREAVREGPTAAP